MTFTIDPRAGTLELGALFLGVLAYPKEEQKRDLFMGALICAAVSEMKRDTNRYGEPPRRSVSLAQSETPH